MAFEEFRRLFFFFTANCQTDGFLEYISLYSNLFKLFNLKLFTMVFHIITYNCVVLQFTPFKW